MAGTVDLILAFVLLMNFLVLGSSALRSTIRAAAFQGVLLASLPLLVPGEVGGHLALMALGAALIKGMVIPGLLFRALRDAAIRHETEPHVGFVPSLLLCGLGTAFALLWGGGLPVAPEHRGLLLMPASLATVLSGFLVLTTRRKAITQVVGYLVLENGIFVFGVMLVGAMPLVVELGVLLDLLVGIFVMGILMHHIQREFSSLDTERLSGLREH